MRFVLLVATCLLLLGFRGIVPSPLLGLDPVLDSYSQLSDTLTLEEMSPTAFLGAIRTHDQGGLRVAEFPELALDRDVGRLRFSQGTIALLEVGGEVVGAVVDAPGRFEMTPPDPVEQWQLSRFFEEPSAAVEVEGAVLLFADSTLQELQQSLEFERGGAGSRIGDLLEDASKYLSHTSGVGVGAIRAFLNGEDEIFFHVYLKARRGGPYFFQLSSLEAEEVSFGRRADGRGDRYEVICAFHGQNEYPNPDPREEALHNSDILHFDIESWIDEGLDFSARATAYLTTELSRGDWVSLSLSADLEVDSMRWDDGSEATFLRGSGGRWIWLELPENPGFRQLTAWYHGKIVEYRDFFYWFDNPTGWYPRLGQSASTFDLTFHVNRRYGFLASGTRTDQIAEGDLVTSHWKVETPERLVSFNLGDFEEHLFEFPGLPPVRLHVNDNFHERLSAASIFLQQNDVPTAVAADLTGSLSFFQEVYGPLDVKEFNASEVPYAHGLAFPSLIHLSVLTFLQSGNHDDGENEVFRAHEVAHQWWGLSVEPRSYRDWWLAEGLAQFSGLWYMQIARLNPEEYFGALEDSRNRIMDRRGKAGPISLGTRVAIGNRDEDYGTIIYEKGAWVIHMLRNLLMDMEAMDESAFERLMMDVATRYKNRRITTQEFQRVVEEHLGNMDMQWFFDQWVYGSDIPTYRWAWTGEEVEGGYQFRLRVRQEDVPADFQMVVPVTVDFGEEGMATVKVMVAGPETVAELPLLPRKPDEVRFNDFESVLARVRKEGW